MKTIKILPLLLLLIYSATQCSPKKENYRRSELFNKLSAIEDVTSISLIANTFGHERYLITFRQPLDISDPDAGTFEQRVIIDHVGFDTPTVYGIQYYELNTAPDYSFEVSKRYNYNFVQVEYRFYGESLPVDKDWKYLKARLAADDYHRIRVALQTIYPGKWWGEGTCKGGENLLTYMTYYPDDIAYAVTTCAPFILGLDDPRFDSFLDKVGSDTERQSLVSFQRTLLKRKAEILPYFEKYAKSKKLDYSIPVADIYEFAVLELSVIYWQNHLTHKRRGLPDSDSSAQRLAQWLSTYGNIGEYAMDYTHPIQIQTILESGYYGFSTRMFRDLLTINTTEHFRKIVSEECRNYVTDESYVKDVMNYLEHNDPKVVCLYWEYDPFSAVALPDALFAGKQNMHKFFGPEGSHGGLINRLPAAQQDEIWAILDKWANE